MIEIKTKLQKWGNSFGLVVPVNAVKEGKMKEGDEIKIFVEKSKKNNVLRETFGTLKLKKSTEKIMKEIDKELDIGL